MHEDGHFALLKTRVTICDFSESLDGDHEQHTTCQVQHNHYYVWKLVFSN